VQTAAYAYFLTLRKNHVTEVLIAWTRCSDISSRVKDMLLQVSEWVRDVEVRLRPKMHP